jgi:hypothetical protein
MRFHWFDRGSDASIDHLKTISNIVDEVGYESMLMVYHSKIDDNWVKAARALDLNHKFKYMPAVRTYAISPEYCAMICKAFHTIAPNRIMLNIVSGDLQEEETSVEDMIWFGKDLDTQEKRLKYTDDWLSKFLELSNNTVSGIVMGGHSSQTRLLAKKYNATHLGMLGLHRQLYDNPEFVKNKKQMLSVCVIINESEEEIENMLSKKPGSNEWTICGTPDNVKIELNSLKDLGVTDLLISNHSQDTNKGAIHHLMKEMIGEHNGI